MIPIPIQMSLQSLIHSLFFSLSPTKIFLYIWNDDMPQGFHLFFHHLCLRSLINFKLLFLWNEIQIMWNGRFIWQSASIVLFRKTANEIAVHKAVEIGFINPNRIQIVTIYLYQQNTDEKRKEPVFTIGFFFGSKFEIFFRFKKTYCAELQSVMNPFIF